MKVALVAGATGAVGKALVYQLLEDTVYAKVVVLVRKPIHMKHHKLHQVQVNFDQLDYYKSELGCDDVYCCLGTTIAVAGSKEQFYKIDHDYVIQLAKLTKQQGANQFVLVSAMGASASSAIFYNKVKGETEQHLVDITFAKTIIVRPSLLLARRTEVRVGEWIAQKLMKATRFVFSGPLKKYRAIEVERVAEAMRYYAHKPTTGVFYYSNNELFIQQ